MNALVGLFLDMSSMVYPLASAALRGVGVLILSTIVIGYGYYLAA